MFKLSVVITAYQAENTIGRAIRSVLNTPRKNEIEIIVVDDCSTDNTHEVVLELQKNYPNIKFYKMPQNSGSPSEPRNFGIRMASGEYVSVLDDDDEYNVSSLIEMLDEAIERDLDFVKGYMIVKEGNKSIIANRLPAVQPEGIESIKAIIQFLSLGDFIIRRHIIIDNNLKYDKDIKIGEDGVFVTSVLAKTMKVAYIDKPYLIYHKVPEDVSNLSSTQKCGDREVSNQILAWENDYQNLIPISINFYELRLCAGLRNLLLSIVRYSDGISEDCFYKLNNFVVETKKYTYGFMSLSKRYEELYQAILSGNYDNFKKEAKRRLLITGYDLKFILPVIQYLSDEYEIKVDEWTGHDSHNEKQSREMAAWADIIWCEWMLGNAVYYTKLKNKNQRLVIHAHRFEITRDFGDKINFDKVDAVFLVGYYYYEKFIKRFSIPRNKVRLLSNYCEEKIYSTLKKDDFQYHIGIIGIIPRLKGFFKGLEILKILVQTDKRFKLYIMGNSPEQVSWIKNNPVEAQYYKECDDYIVENKLEDNIVYGGFIERKNLYNNIGFVLSLSELESFHLAPAEGACSGCVGLFLNWSGVEYIYPKRFIFKNTQEIADKIIKLAENESEFKKESDMLKKYVIDNYSIEYFLEILKRYLVQIRIMG